MTIKVLRLAWALAIVAGAALRPNELSARVLTIGAVSPYPAMMMERFGPIANYLAAQLRAEGVDGVKVVVVTSVPALSQALAEGRMDFYFDDAFSSAALARLSRSEPFLRRWRGGVDEQRSVFFARKDSGVKRLEDLPGRIIALENPFSGTGYFLPKFFLIQKGLRLVQKADPKSGVHPGEVGYVFSGDDENTMAWVTQGKMQAAAMGENRYKREIRNSANQVTIIGETFFVPRQLVNYNKNLSPELVARVKRILIEMERGEEGKSVLKAFEDTAKFDEIPSQSRGVMGPLGEWVVADLQLR